MTNQEAFDIMVRHLAQQTEQCTSRGSCVYAGPNGNACAVGVLLPRELSERLDKYLRGTWSDIVHVAAERDSGDCNEAVEHLAGVSHELLRVVQKVHDGLEWDDRMGKLPAIAERFGLTMPDLSK